LEENLAPFEEWGPSKGLGLSKFSPLLGEEHLLPSCQDTSKCIYDYDLSCTSDRQTHKETHSPKT